MVDAQGNSMQNTIKRATFILCAFALLPSCEDAPVLPTIPEPTVDPGALVSITLDGKVGVLLDELPPSARDRAADSIMNRPESFWLARAREQFRLTQLRLNFRQFFYPEADKKLQLPIPPEEKIHFQFAETGPVRATVDGHDLVTLDYHFQGYLVTTLDSPEKSEPALKEIGGVWDEPMMFPVDPTLLLERTGYACMDEGGYPPDSVETENAYLFYDDTCKTETPTAIVCHFTMPQPPVDCNDAVRNKIGRVDTAFHFERIAWDDAIAAENRVGEVTQPDAADLAVRPDFLNNNHVVYRYFPEDACEMQEKCIGAPGWRRLLMFDAVDHNVGGAPLNIGAVDYYLQGGDVENQFHGMYEYSACHKHYHFKHYGEFKLEGVEVDTGYKPGFCLQSTDRLSNNESSPMSNPYGSCSYQGVEVGWGDKYQAGLPCQWLDITDSGIEDEVEATLGFRSNPDEFLCEGAPVLDASGKQVWEKTDFKTADDKPVDRPKCDFFEGASDNDLGQTTVSIGKKGGVMTGPCQKNQIGPNRNCEFTEQSDASTCTPGEKVTLHCGVADPGKPQVVRVCDYSFTLGQATTCSAYDARVNETVTGADVQVEFTCPEKRTDTEKGGRYAIFTAPAWGPDGPSLVTCVSD